MSSKLKPLRSQAQLQEEQATLSHKLDFLVPNKYRLSAVEVIIITLAWEIADEAYGNDTESHHMREFAQDIQENMTLYVVNGQTVACGLRLIQAEIKERKKKLKKVQINSSSVTSTKTSHKYSTGWIKSMLTFRIFQILPSMKYLIDRSRGHFSHQYWVKDSR